MGIVYRLVEDIGGGWSMGRGPPGISEKAWSWSRVGRKRVE